MSSIPESIEPAAAVALQKRLAARVDLRPPADFEPGRIAGADVAFPRPGRRAVAAIAVCRWPGLELVETATAELPVGFPYVPGLLSFRELPALLAALGRLDRPPDLVPCDGQGIAHPRRFGIACHLGIETGLVTIGVGKSRLCGQHRTPGDKRGSWTRLKDEKAEIGRVLRTRCGVTNEITNQQKFSLSLERSWQGVGAPV